MAGEYVPITDAIQMVEAAREARLARPVPYSDDPASNPFGVIMPCPVIGCAQVRARDIQMRQHLRKTHDCETAADVSALNAKLRRRLDAVQDRIAGMVGDHREGESNEDVG
jgi:hypothetical protein